MGCQQDSALPLRHCVITRRLHESASEMHSLAFFRNGYTQPGNQLVQIPQKQIPDHSPLMQRHPPDDFPILSLKKTQCIAAVSAVPIKECTCFAAHLVKKDRTSSPSSGSKHLIRIASISIAIPPCSFATLNGHAHRTIDVESM